MNPEDAMAHIAAPIDKLNMRSDGCEADLAMLSGIGTLARGPGRAHEPDWVPPMLRP